MKKIQKNAARFDNLKQDFLDDKKYSGTAKIMLNDLYIYIYFFFLVLISGAASEKWKGEGRVVFFFFTKLIKKD